MIFPKHIEKKKRHKVLPNETMAQIAANYDVTVQDIRSWNGMRTSTIYPGQMLTIMLTERKLVEGTHKSSSSSSSSSSSKSSSSSNSKINYSYDGKYKYYTLKNGESLWTVSQKLGIPFAQIQELNKDLDPKRMQPGDKIRIQKI